MRMECEAYPVNLDSLFPQAVASLLSPLSDADMSVPLV